MACGDRILETALCLTISLQIDDIFSLFSQLLIDNQNKKDDDAVAVTIDCKQQAVHRSATSQGPEWSLLPVDIPVDTLTGAPDKLDGLLNSGQSRRASRTPGRILSAFFFLVLSDLPSACRLTIPSTVCCQRIASHRL